MNIFNSVYFVYRENCVKYVDPLRRKPSKQDINAIFLYKICIHKAQKGKPEK